jgi:hypothetical protein
MMSTTEEDFELELRTLPGVLNVGIDHGTNGEVEGITLVVIGQNPGTIRTLATQIANLYFPEVSITVEVADTVASVSSGESARVALLSADFDEAAGVCQVQLAYAGRVGVGTSSNGSLIGAAEGTLAALRDLDCEIPFYLEAVANVPTVRGWPVVVTLRSYTNDGELFGIAQSDGDLMSAARATLNALNRFLTNSDS